MKIARTERGNTRGDATKTAALFTQFLPHKSTPLSTLEEYSGYRLPRYQLQAHTMIQYKVCYNVSDVAMKLSLDAIQAKDGALWIVSEVSPD